MKEILNFIFDIIKLKGRDILTKKITAAHDFPGNYFALIPNICPYCAVASDYQILQREERKADFDHLETAVILQCPNCKNFIFAQFLDNGRYKVYPQPQPYPNISKEILTEYPEFAKVYLQALTAESQNLDEICGMGYRKAIEYLVKRYAEQLFQDDKDNIENEPLSKTINRIPDADIQLLARKISWLGNDQVHIVAKHPDYGIVDMKNFIEALSYFILMKKRIQQAATISPVK